MLYEVITNKAIKFIDRLRGILSSVDIREGDGSAETPGPIESQTAPKPAPAGNDGYKTLGEILVSMGAVDSEQVDEALKEQVRPLGEILVDKGVVDRQVVDTALREQQSQAAAAEVTDRHEVVRREIRVDTAKLDKLFELVGELIRNNFV